MGGPSSWATFGFPPYCAFTCAHSGCTRHASCVDSKPKHKKKINVSIHWRLCCPSIWCWSTFRSSSPVVISYHPSSFWLFDEYFPFWGKCFFWLERSPTVSRGRDNPEGTGKEEEGTWGTRVPPCVPWTCSRNTLGKTHRWPPTKHLVQILRGGSSSSSNQRGSLIRDLVNRNPPCDQLSCPGCCNFRRLQAESATVRDTWLDSKWLIGFKLVLRYPRKKETKRSHPSPPCQLVLGNVPYAPFDIPYPRQQHYTFASPPPVSTPTPIKHRPFFSPPKGGEIMMKRTGKNHTHYQFSIKTLFSNLWLWVNCLPMIPPTIYQSRTVLLNTPTWILAQNPRDAHDMGLGLKDRV